MSTYGQFCPIAKSLEILGDRWTLLIVRDMLTGTSHFNELERGLPGISRGLLARRLRQLQQAGIVAKQRNDGRIYPGSSTNWGTANRVDPSCSCYRGYTASFIGFAPADAPRLVISVTLQNPKGDVHFGGLLGGPVFKSVMSFALQTLDVPPTGTASPKMRLVAP